MNNSYKHSGAFGDLLYSLPIVKHTGGGQFYLHLNQINWIGQHYYGSSPNPFHQGRLTQEDFEYAKEFMLAQEYISGIDVFQPSTEITHNLDKFRKPFVGHPGNYVDIYAGVFGITDKPTLDKLRNEPWLTVPKANPVAEIVINRTHRWIAGQIPEVYLQAKDLNSTSVFVGLKDEHEKFVQETGWMIDYYATKNQLELASVIAGSDQFIGNQSQALALAIGLGVDFACELRRDLPLDRNECYFADHPHGEWF